MINPLKIATAGYLKRTTKAVLIIAVAGYLNYSTTPPVPSRPSVASGIGVAQQLQKEDKTWMYEEEEILTILKIWAKCQG